MVGDVRRVTGSLGPDGEPKGGEGSWLIEVTAYGSKAYLALGDTISISGDKRRIGRGLAIRLGVWYT